MNKSKLISQSEKPSTPSLMETIGIPAAVSFAIIAFAASDARAHGHEVSITDKGDQLCFTGNGMPSHAHGQFPNSGNPHSIKKQNVNLCVTKTPKRGTKAKQVRGSIGVALNGVQIRPGTADYYDASTSRGFSRNRRSGWNLEGLGARDQLGMDKNNAHVDERGLYHYHGVSKGLLSASKGSLIGYAADGFEIHYIGKKATPSYQLKTGTRPTAPGGTYDGTYNEDFKFVRGSGMLDRCNGGYLNGEFVYFATDAYPFFPRCLWGKVSSDFLHKGQQRKDKTAGIAGKRKQRAEGKRQRNAERKQRRQDRRAGNRRPPQRAISACEGQASNSECSFSGRGGRSVIGSCQSTPSNVIACVPERGKRRKS